MNEREFELLNIIGKELGSNQRDLSQKMDLSLGMINMLIRRLITKGYIRIEQLNKRKVQYLLTSKGFSEKMQKSIKYTVNTINSIGLIRENMKELLGAFYNKGFRKFYIYSEGDLSSVIEKAFYEAQLEDAQLIHLKELPLTDVDGLVMVGKEDVNIDEYKFKHCVDVLKEISIKQDFTMRL